MQNIANLVNVIYFEKIIKITLTAPDSRYFLANNPNGIFQDLQFLDDKVEVVPSVVGKESGIEGERQFGHVRLCLLPREVLCFSLA